MGGEGELVRYKRIRALTKEKRDELKDEIIAMIDNVAEEQAITVIALVDEPKNPTR